MLAYEPCCWPSTQTAARRQHSRRQQRWCVQAAGQEGESSTATEAEASLEAPTAPPGSEKPGDKVEVPDVSAHPSPPVTVHCPRALSAAASKVPRKRLKHSSGPWLCLWPAGHETTNTSCAPGILLGHMLAVYALSYML